VSSFLTTHQHITGHSVPRDKGQSHRWNIHSRDAPIV